MKRYINNLEYRENVLRSCYNNKNIIIFVNKNLNIMNRLFLAFIAILLSELSLHGTVPYKTVVSPDYIARKDGSLKIKHIELYKDSTVVTFGAFNYPGKSVTVDSAMVIEADGKIYKPLKSEGAELGVPMVMTESRTQQFKIVYPPIKKKTKLMDVVDLRDGKVFAGVRLDGKKYDRITSDKWHAENAVPYPGRPDTLVYDRPRKAVVRGMFTGYDKQMHGSNFLIYNTDELLDQSKPIVVPISDDGSFEVEIDCYMPKHISAIIWKCIMRSMYIEPGRELKLFFDFDRLIGQYWGFENQRTTIFNGGELGSINEDLICSPKMWGYHSIPQINDSTPLDSVLQLIQQTHEANKETLNKFFSDFNIGENSKDLITHCEKAEMVGFLARMVSDAKFKAFYNKKQPPEVPAYMYDVLKHGFNVDDIAVAATHCHLFNSLAFSDLDRLIGSNDEYLYIIRDFGLAYLKSHGAELTDEEQKTLDWIDCHDGEEMWLSSDSLMMLRSMPFYVAKRTDMLSVYKHFSDSVAKSGAFRQSDFKRSIVRNLSRKAREICDYVDTEEPPLWWQIVKASYLATYGGMPADVVDQRDAMEVVKQLKDNGVFTSEAVCDALKRYYLTAYNLIELPETSGGDLVRSIIEPYKGKYVLMDLLATTCGPCRAGIEHSMEFRVKNRGNDDFAFVFVTSESNSPRKDYDEYSKIYLDGEDCHYLDNSDFNLLRELFEFNGIPRYVLFDRDGNVASKNFAGPYMLPDFLDRQGINYIK